MKATDMSPVEGRQLLAMLRELIELAGLLIPYINNRHPDGPIRTGGYFRVWQRIEPDGSYLEVLGCAVGELGVKLPKYLSISCEKGERLAEYLDHVSSWQSRNEDSEMYGGAIRCGPFIFSFSGLPEKWDEALMILLARKFHLLDVAQEEAIIQVSKNECLALFGG